MTKYDNPEILDDIYPSDIGLELSLLGWVLLDEKLMAEIGFIQPKDFYSEPYKDIFTAMVALFSKGEQITPFMIKPLLSKKRIDSFADLGGVVQYLGQAMIECRLNPWPVDIAKYLHKLSQKRTLMLACEDAIAADERVTIEESADQLSRVIDKITRNSPINEFQSNHDVTEQIFADLKDNKLPYQTGLKKLDIAMGGGLFSGKSYGFAARKKVGKTALAATISANLNEQGVKHLFICGEMSPKEIHQRVLARMAGIFPSAYRNDYAKRKDCEMKLAEAATAMQAHTLYKNAPGLTFDELKRICTSAVDRHCIKGFILDYWQLVGGKLKNQSTAEHLDDVAQWIADFGRKHDIWTITFAQLNQEDNTRGGEGIRLAFDQLYQLHRPNLTQPEASLEMMETRYTPWNNITGLSMNDKGPFFEEL